jgi:hypothetical protein
MEAHGRQRARCHGAAPVPCPAAVNRTEGGGRTIRRIFRRARGFADFLHAASGRLTDGSAILQPALLQTSFRQTCKELRVRLGALAMGVGMLPH